MRALNTTGVDNLKIHGLFSTFPAWSQQQQLLRDISGNRPIGERHNKAVLAVLFNHKYS